MVPSFGQSWKPGWEPEVRARLPLFLNKENKYVLGWLMFTLATILYLASNRFHFFVPSFLPMSWVDNNVPFLPNTVWIYLSEYFFFAAIFMASKDIENLNKYFYSFFSLQMVSVLIFWIWPTTFPRDLYPLPSDLNALTLYAFNTLRQTDSPASCCPSLHVSAVYLSCFIYLDEQRNKFPIFLIWATLIAFSTLTTKQHYLIDVVAGIAMAALAYVVFHRWASYRPWTFGRKLQANR